MNLARRSTLRCLAAAALGRWAGQAMAAEPAAPARILQRWLTGDTRLAPPGSAGSDIVHAGEHRVGLLRPGLAQALWQRPHGLTGPAVFRPRADTRQVLAGSLRTLAAWHLGDGTMHWQRQAEQQFGTPCLDRGMVFLGDGHQLLALDAGLGELRWRVDTTPDTLMSYAPTVAGDRVLAGPGNGLLYALSREDGRRLWTLDLSHEWQYLRQLHVGDGVLVAGSYKELLYGISLETGRVLWKFNAGNFINSHHVSGQTAFLWSPTGWIFALDVNTGALRWRHRTTAYDGHKDAWASVLAELASDELYLYALDMGHVLHVLDRHTGEERARIAISPVLRPAQLVQQPRQIVVASEAGEVLRMGV